MELKENKEGRQEERHREGGGERLVMLRPLRYDTPEGTEYMNENKEVGRVRPRVDKNTNER